MITLFAAQMADRVGPVRTPLIGSSSRNPRLGEEVSAERRKATRQPDGRSVKSETQAANIAVICQQTV